MEIERVDNPNAVSVDSMYDRQRTLGIRTALTVNIVGCGGVGSWVALTLALAGVERLRLFDSDTVSIHNLNRLPFDASAIGKPKVTALEELIAKLRPECKVEVYVNLNKRLHKSVIAANSYDNPNKWMVVSTDSLKSRKEAYELSKVCNLRYVECAAEGHMGTVAFSPADFSTPEEEQPGYRSVPVFIGPCIAAAAIAAYYVLLGKPDECTFHVGWEQDRVELSRIEDNDPEPVAEPTAAAASVSEVEEAVQAQPIQVLTPIGEGEFEIPVVGTDEQG